jgi:hypothetical protein
MRTAAIDSGSISDRLNAVTALLKSCPDLAAIRYRWSRIVQRLQGVLDRTSLVQRRGGEPVGITAPLAWLESTIREHEAFTGLDGESLRAELLEMIRRIAPGR